jgi:hypothetical protein
MQKMAYIGKVGELLRSSLQEAQHGCIGSERYIVLASQNGSSWAGKGRWVVGNKNLKNVNLTIWVVSGALVRSVFNVWTAFQLPEDCDAVMVDSLLRRSHGTLFLKDRKRRRDYMQEGEILWRYAIVDRAVDASWDPGQDYAHCGQCTNAHGARHDTRAGACPY